MATVKFYLRGKSNPAKIYVRFSVSRDLFLRTSTPLNVNPEFFNNKTGKVRRIAHFKEKDALQEQLNQFENFINSRYNNDIQKKSITGVSWLKDCINDFFNVVTKKDLNRLHNYALHYVELLKIKRNDQTGEIGASIATIKKHTTIANKIEAFEKYKKRKYLVSDVGLNFRNEFLIYLLEVENLGRNTVGRYIKFLKTICLSARRNGYNTNPKLEEIKGFSVKVDSIYLNFEELAKIEKKEYKDDTLNIVKDWLIIGCYIGQRGGDLLNLTKNNIVYNGGLEFIELTQQKTKKKVSVLIHPKVKSILEKREGNFPPRLCKNIESAKTLFNRHLKKVGQKAKINELINGAKVNPETKRKENGTFEKWELISSHICRRSFASNYYGTMPTALIKNITGHSTEKDFLLYIGKTNIDYATELAKYWNIEQQKIQIQNGEKETPLRIAK